LSGKAADARMAARFVYELAMECDDGTLHARHRIACCWGLMQYYAIIMKAGRWMSDLEIQQCEEAVYTCLVNYYALRSIMIGLGHLAMYRPKPKAHMWLHLIDDFIKPTRLNPRNFWCYGGEDFVGRVKRIAAACHRTSVVVSVLKRYLFGKQIALADTLRSIVR
jgi:hypothetical protein